jgi:hypothetical protein
MIFKILLSLVLITNSILAHSGGTNSDGCHNDYSNNTYHCHNGGSDSGSVDTSGAMLGLAIVAIGSLAYYYFFKNKSYATGVVSPPSQEKCQIFVQNGVVVSVKSVEVFEFSKLKVTFNTQEKKIFDVSPYLNKGIFTELKNIDYFRQVKVSNGIIEWPNGQDFCPDTLYMKGE